MYACRGDEDFSAEASWISMVDVFILTAVFSFGVAMLTGLVARALWNDNQAYGVQIPILIAQGKDLSAEVDRLKGEAEALRDRLKHLQPLEGKVASLSAKLADLEGKHAAGEERIARLSARAKQLEADLARENGRRTKLEDQATELAGIALDFAVQLEYGSREVDRLLKESRRLHADIGAMRQEHGSISQELIGLRGNLERVALVIDRSNSMSERWDHTVKTVKTWTEHLSMGECVVIVFNHEVESYPPGRGQLVRLAGPGGAGNKESMHKWLQRIQPSGLTNTLDALRRAYEYNPKMIILFTDGAPRTSATPKEAELDMSQRRQVVDLVKAHPQVPINAIGLGTFYRDRKLSEFLLELASLSRGTFLGR